MRKLLSLRMTESWHRLHEEVVESSFLEILRTNLDMVLDS